MNNLYEINGLVFWSEDEIALRQWLTDRFSHQVKEILWGENSAWRFVRVEAPVLTPQQFLSPAYSKGDVFLVDGDDALMLRPETTSGSYAAAQRLLHSHSGHKPPLCVWQSGKSFRREQDQVSKNMRLKEFYQQEFQCLYAADTFNNYHGAVIEPVRKMLGDALGLPARAVPSDRLPSYSEITMDIEIDNGEKWMEVCSISRRTDYPGKLVFPGRNGPVEKSILVLEIAIGLDRCVYCYGQRCAA